jgi:hypothetical protein
MERMKTGEPCRNCGLPVGDECEYPYSPACHFERTARERNEAKAEVERLRAAIGIAEQVRDAAQAIATRETERRRKAEEECGLLRRAVARRDEMLASYGVGSTEGTFVEPNMAVDWHMRELRPGEDPTAPVMHRTVNGRGCVSRLLTKRRR